MHGIYCGQFSDGGNATIASKTVWIETKPAYCASENAP